MKNMKTIDCKKWFILTLILAFCVVTGIGVINIIIDPFFHYHAPLSSLAYPINNERYQNDGILKHFEYDAIITGSSMTENFKTSEFDRLFNTRAVKTPFEGASFKEINDRLRAAMNSSNDIKLVLQCLDMDYLVKDKDTLRTDLGSFPEYLYDDNIWNDMKYILNKDVFVYSAEVLYLTVKGMETTSFDQYKNWSDKFLYGKEIVCSTFERKKYAGVNKVLSEEEKKILKDNIIQNIGQIANDYPDTEFILYFSPYSICWWDSLAQDGKLEWEFEVQKIVIEELLKHKNIKLYSFFTNTDLICDLNNYKDIYHYGGWVNSNILHWISENKYLLTESNYMNYLDEIKNYYGSYEYDMIYEF